METEKFIQSLVSTAEPVRRLTSPWIRAVVWLAIAVPYISLVVYVVSPRPDLLTKFAELRYFVEQSAALVTAVCAAIAAFAVTVPGFSRKVLFLPAVPLVVWLGSLGQGCIQELLENGVGAALRPDWFCLPGIVLVGAVPAIAMVAMLWRGAPMMPTVSVALGGLAAAALGNFGLRMFHTQDASLMVLFWQFGSVFVLAIIAGSAGRFVLNWDAVLKKARHRLPLW